MRKSMVLVLMLAVVVGLTAFGQSAPPAAGSNLTIGLVMVGPYNDHGWSQANYDGLQYVLAKVPGTKLVYIDKANSADRPGTTVSQLGESLVAQGAKLVIFSSDDMTDEAIKFAQAHKDIFVILTSGDQQWKDGKAYKPLPNMINIMGRMEYMKMCAGVAAALTTKTGKIGFLGPLINDETRRLASSAYLGARYAWVNYLKKDPAKLDFKVTWIGFWFNIPGVTSDPTQVADDFFNSGYDVVISGIDTTEAVAEAAKFTAQGKQVWAIPYDYSKALDEGKGVSLGVPYFNWGPAYVNAAKAAMSGKWVNHFEWNAPYWKNINDPDMSAVGFNKGTLSKDAAAGVDKFIAELGKGLTLWKGPLNLQDGTPYLASGKAATDQQIWYLPQLLQGMQGQSVSK
ncbi:MAG TPA: BMP family ABC transporter substrate-binding protein [Rectinemataceae bacterium]|nr:BMP family ABC transporter substrate-binding protein [Rectinemataceae bacterium]